MDIKERIQKAKDKVSAAEKAEVAAKQDLKNYTEQREEVVAKMKEFGVTPETAQAELETLEGRIMENLDKVEQLTPEV
ncbi:MAG TPA: hypothetical protein VN258_07530 [Mobilitalea sp.]|nr:hypothetical protein [Mobilitalea sp.]